MWDLIFRMIFFIRPGQDKINSHYKLFKKKKKKRTYVSILATCSDVKAPFTASCLVIVPSKIKSDAANFRTHNLTSSPK